ncbi:hypothetical protein DFH11DRAFT_1603881 [Phellopilus nigrolimitatus]|nr:hypothetical protein DFH11DRAFT_1603881 [Phellopilus nigrolimitatus]
MLLNRDLNHDSPTRRAHECTSPSKTTTSNPTYATPRPLTPCPAGVSLSRPRVLSRPPSPHPSSATISNSSAIAGLPSQPQSPRPRTLSRTQLRHANAARRLSVEGLGKDEYGGETAAPPISKPASLGSAKQSSPRQGQAKRPASPPVAVAKPPPYLRDTMDVAGVGLISDSANMETLISNKHFLRASFMSPESVIDKIQHSDNFYHVWVAAMLAMEELSIKKNGFDKVLRLAFTKFLVELGSAIVDCLKPDLPHYTFVDPRGIMQPEGTEAIFEQAVDIVEGLEKKGIKRDRIYISIPATETGLMIANALKEQHAIKTNLVFVSGLAQAAACAAAGAAAVTMPVKSILAYHEVKRGLNSSNLVPHPGRQNIKATACYMKHHELETQVIASGLRSLNEIEHCAALTSVCLADFQVETAKWHRMRVNRPPAPKSTAMMRASQVPFPPESSQGEFGFKYLTAMSGETRKETLAVLDAGLKTWTSCVTSIAWVIRGEMERRLSIGVFPLVKTVAKVSTRQAIEYRRQVQAERCRSLTSRGLPRQDTLAIPFPSTSDKRSKLVVPQSPYWQDLDTFDEVGTSSRSSDEKDMIVF